MLPNWVDGDAEFFPTINTPSLHCKWNSLKTLLSWTSTVSSIRTPGHYSNLSTTPPFPSLSSECSSSKNKPARWFSLANKKKSQLLTKCNNKTIRLFMIRLGPTSVDSSFNDLSHTLMLSAEILAKNPEKLLWCLCLWSIIYPANCLVFFFFQ